MDLPPCTLLAEATRLEVGHGVALADVEAKVTSTTGGCRLDLRASLLSREEGRAPPELVVFRGEVDGKELKAGGPLGPAVMEVDRRGGRVRVLAVLRGERFVTVPLSIDRSMAKSSVPFRAMAHSDWGTTGIAGRAHWVDVGVPALVTVDPTRDHEPLELVEVVDDKPAPVVVIDAGPALGTDAPQGTAVDRDAASAPGGLPAVTLLLSDAPLAVATAADDETALARLREAARFALVASSSKEPIYAALGQRLTTAIASGFTTCKREGDVSVPSGWPDVRRDLASTGVLADAEAGCPRVSVLLAANHPSLQFVREGATALREALFAAEKSPPKTMGPVAARSRPLGPDPAHARGRGRRGRVALVLISLALGAFLAWKLRTLGARAGTL